MKKLLVSSLAIILVSFTACKKEKEDQLGLYTNVESITGDIYFTMQSDFYTPDGNIALYCRTAKEYPCINYPLLYEKTLNGNTLVIEFKGVNAEDFCLTAIGPATCSIPLNDLSEGVYNVLFYLNDIKYKYTIQIKDGLYRKLSGEYDDGVIFY